MIYLDADISIDKNSYERTSRTRVESNTEVKPSAAKVAEVLFLSFFGMGFYLPHLQGVSCNRFVYVGEYVVVLIRLYPLHILYQDVSLSENFS